MEEEPDECQWALRESGTRYGEGAAQQWSLQSNREYVIVCADLGLRGGAHAQSTPRRVLTLLRSHAKPHKKPRTSGTGLSLW